MRQRPIVTVIIPVYNVEHVLADVLKSIYSQTYPIEEILLIDNHSHDRSVAVAQAFIKTHHRIPIRIIQRKKTYGLSHSYNLGVSLARSKYVVTLHSDSMLPTKHELGRLMIPMLSDPNCIAAMPIVVHRRQEWMKYNFWQKCLFAQSVGKEQHNLNGKFDVYKKSIFLQIGGYDTTNFNHYIGSEDADMHFRLLALGTVVATNARVVHLHGLDTGYTLSDWIRRRRFLAISYARQIQLHWKDMGSDRLPFLVKPVLACFVLGVYIHPLFAIPIMIFPFWYMKSMFIDSRTRKDIRILSLPFIVIYLVFAETIWTAKALITGKYSL